MPSPTKNDLSISDVESKYDAYLLTARGLSRSTRNLHHHVVHMLLSSRFPSGDVDWNKIRFNDFAQFSDDRVRAVAQSGDSDNLVDDPPQLGPLFVPRRSRPSGLGRRVAVDCHSETHFFAARTLAGTGAGALVSQ